MALKKGDFVRYKGKDPNGRGNLTVNKLYELEDMEDPHIYDDKGGRWYIGEALGNASCFVKVFGALDEEPPQSDAVNSPAHYKRGKFETIEVIEHIVGGYSDPFVAYAVGNAIKYADRAPYKHDNPAECLRKAAWYLTRAADHIEGKSEGDSDE